MAHDLLDSLLTAIGHPPVPAEEVEIAGVDPVYDTPFRVGEVAAAVLAACGIAVSDLWELRTGRRQKVRMEVRAAAATLTSFIHLRAPQLADWHRPPHATIGLFPARDGGWIHLHGGFPHLHEGLIELLGCQGDRESIAHAVTRWDAQALEDAIADRGLCGARVRTASEWAAHPQGRALAKQPVLEILRIGDSQPEPLGPAERPLTGVRVLDLTRVLAGPTCGRTLAEHGADVMRVHAPHLPTVRPFVIDTGHGKLSTNLDLRCSEDAARLRALVCEGDVFSRGYRDGALEKHGFGVGELAALRPGIIAVSTNCYGHEGPWRGRPGWEQLAQTTTGIAAEQGSLDRPELIPAAATDYTTGYLAALGALVAIVRRARDGGSYHVRVSLSRSAMWLLDTDRVRGEPSGFGDDLLDRYLLETETPEGRIHHLGPVLELSETPPHWARPSAPLGSHPATWPQRMSSQ